MGQYGKGPVVCCPAPAKRRKAGRKGRRGKSGLVACCEKLLAAVEALDIPPGDPLQYAIWLLEQKRKFILRQRWYPNWQQEWG